MGGTLPFITHCARLSPHKLYLFSPRLQRTLSRPPSDLVNQLTVEIIESSANFCESSYLQLTSLSSLYPPPIIMSGPPHQAPPTTSAPKRKHVDDTPAPYKRATFESAPVSRDVQAGPVDPRRDTTEYMRSQSQRSSGSNFAATPEGPLMEPFVEAHHVRLDPVPPLMSNVLTFEKLDRPKHPYTPRDANRVRGPDLLPPVAATHPHDGHYFAPYSVAPPASYQGHAVQQYAGDTAYPSYEVMSRANKPVDTTTDEYFAAMFRVKQPGFRENAVNQPVEQRFEPFAVQSAHLPQLKDFEVASEHVESARMELLNRKPHVPQIPAIPRTYHFDFNSEVMAFKPSEIWNLRHMRANDRLKTHLSFVFHYKKMIVTPPNTPNWWQAWSGLKTRTAVLRGAEHALYIRFSPYQGENEASRTKREAEWVQLVGEQDRAWCVDPATKLLRPVNGPAVQEPAPILKATEDFPAVDGRPAGEIVSATPEPAKDVSNPVPAPGRNSKKRPAAAEIEIDPGQVRPPVKTARGPDNKSPTPEGSKSPRCPPVPDFKTTVRDTLEDQKKNGYSGNAPKYSAYEKELGIGRTSKFAWMAHLQTEQVAEQAKLPPKTERWGYTDEKNASLPYYQRAYSGDSVKLPDHPSENINDYALDSNNRYQCFHREGKCALKDGSCVHPCCKDGIDLKGLKGSIGKSRDTYRKAVVREVCSGNLDTRHIFWGVLNKEQEKIAERLSYGGRVYKKIDPKPHVFVPESRARKTSTPKTSTPKTPAPQAPAPPLSQPTVPDVQHTAEEEAYISRIASSRAIYARNRRHPDLDYFDAWWNAARLRRFNHPATDEDKAMWAQPNPSKLRDAPSEAVQKRLDEVERKKKEEEAELERQKQEAEVEKKRLEDAAAASNIEPANDDGLEEWFDDNLDALFEDQDE